MKIYIVTKGCYSDYHIEAVFETKKAANTYMRHHADAWSNCSVEVFDTQDDIYKNLPSEYYYVTVIGKISREAPVMFEAQIEDIYTEIVDEKGKEVTRLIHNGKGEPYSITIKRCYKADETLKKSDAENKTKKVAWEIIGIVEDQLYDGVPVKDIQELICEK